MFFICVCKYLQICQIDIEAFGEWDLLTKLKDEAAAVWHVGESQSLETTTSSLTVAGQAAGVQ